MELDVADLMRLVGERNRELLQVLSTSSVCNDGEYASLVDEILDVGTLTNHLGHPFISWFVTESLRALGSGAPDSAGALSHVLHSVRGLVGHEQPTHFRLSETVVLDTAMWLPPSADLSRVGTLDQAEVTEWRRLHAEAHDLLHKHHPVWSREVSEVISVIGVLEKSGNSVISASVPMVFGAVATSRPRNGLWLANTLVHELQHNKLHALTSLRGPLVSATTKRMYVPWRMDPRPVAGAVHGIYSFYGMLSFWSAQMSATDQPGEKARAQYEFARWRKPLHKCMKAAFETESLTELGYQVLVGISDEVESWQDVSIPAAIDRLARSAFQAHAKEWSKRLDSDIVGFDRFARSCFEERLDDLLREVENAHSEHKALRLIESAG
jgi:hypothetical protein